MGDPKVCDFTVTSFKGDFDNFNIGVALISFVLL